MKASVFFVCFIGLFSTTFGQSAKKLNQQLRAELLLEQEEQDSAYGIFIQTKREFDSIRQLTNRRIDQLSGEEKVVQDLWTRFSEMVKQLKELGEDPYSLVTLFQKQDGIPSYREVTRPIREMLKTKIEFNKVSEELSLEGLKPKEQNVLLNQKIEEYRGYLRFNSIKQEELERNIKQLKEFVPTMDSLSRIYTLLGNEIGSKGGKLRDKLDELRGNYMEKGPRGFPEAYRKVFYDAFPPPQSETHEQAMQNYHVEGEEVYEVVPAPVEAEPAVYEIVDDVALFPGGQDALRTFISKNLRYPEKFKEASVEGKVVLRFIVSEEGEISDIEVRTGVPGCKECDDEVVRMVKSMPRWIPAQLNRKTVKSYSTLIVRFKMQPE